MKFFKAEKNKEKKKLAAAALGCMLAFCSVCSVYASVITDATNKKNEAQQELDNLNSQINEIENVQSNLKQEMDNYDEQLMALLTDRNLLEQDMNKKQGEIDAVNAELENAVQKEQEQYEAMKTRIQYMYENGNSSYWQAVINAKSFTDLLNRVEYISEVYDYDRTQLQTYQETVANVADLKDTLNGELAEMEELEISYKDQTASLEAVIAQKSAELENFDQQLANAKMLANEYAQTIVQQNQIIADEKARLAAEEAARRAAEEKAAQEAARLEAERQAAANRVNIENAAGAAAVMTPSENSSTENLAQSESSASNNTGNGLTSSSLDPAYTTGVSGSDVVAFASQYVGYPYVYGGNSLTQGADCSYFVMACFGQFGISLPRSSYALQSCGQPVSYENARAGDIICYSGHVAIYMGNGKIVHASSPLKGICYGTATYRTILTIRRVL